MKKERGHGGWRREIWKAAGEREGGQRMTCGEHQGSRRHCSGTWGKEEGREGERERETKRESSTAQQRLLLQGTRKAIKVSSC